MKILAELLLSISYAQQQTADNVSRTAHKNKIKSFNYG